MDERRETSGRFWTCQALSGLLTYTVGHSGPKSHTWGAFISGRLLPVSLQSKWGQMEVVAVPKHQWLPIFQCVCSAPSLSRSLFVFLHLKNIYIWKDVIDRI